MEDLETVIDPAMRRMVDQALAVSATGGPDAVRRDLTALLARFEPDEVILTGQIHDHAARVRSFAIAAEVMQGLSRPQRKSA